MTVWQELEKFADECCKKADKHRIMAEEAQKEGKFEEALQEFILAAQWRLRPAIDNQPRELIIADEAYADISSAEKLINKTTNKDLKVFFEKVKDEAEQRLVDIDEMYPDNWIYR